MRIRGQQSLFILGTNFAQLRYICRWNMCIRGTTCVHTHVVQTLLNFRYVWAPFSDHEERESSRKLAAGDVSGAFSLAFSLGFSLV